MQCLQWGTMSNSFFSQFLRIYTPLGPWHCYCLPPALAQDHLLLFRVTSLGGGVSFFSFFLYIGPLLGLIFRIISNYYIFLIQKNISESDSSFAFVYPVAILKTLLFTSVSFTHSGHFHILESFHPVSDCQVSHLKSQFLSFYFPSQKSSVLFDCLQEQAQTPYFCIYEII